jgi:radical SAM superfamily enzyme YgiQ (UPF0313 family)
MIADKKMGKKYKIAFVNPKGKMFAADSKMAGFYKQLEDSVFYKSHPHSGLSLATLILAALTPKEFDLHLIDENFEEIDYDEKIDLAAISAFTREATRAYEIADEFRKRDVKVVIGGIHATVLPDEAKLHADSVFVGEGEETWPEFLQDFKKGETKPFYKAERIFDLTKSPIPRHDLLNYDNYKVAWVQTTRGCPHSCEFCVASRIFGEKYRHKAVNQIVEEIKYIKKVAGINAINFADDNIFCDKKYARELLEAIKHLNIRWFAQSDISVADDEEFLKLLKEAGCSVLFIGFETLSEAGLREIDKTRWKEKRLTSYPEAIKKIQSLGIGIMGAFVLGLDNDDLTIFDRLSDFIIANNLYAAQITILTPVPGSALRERLISEKRLLNKRWDEYSFLDVTYLPKKMTPDELQSGLLSVWKRVYSSEANLQRARHFKQIFAALRKNEVEVYEMTKKG